MSKKNETLDAKEILDSIPPKTVKRTSRYTVMLIPDSTDHAKSFELSFDRILKIIVGIIALCIVLASLLVSSWLKNYKLRSDDSKDIKIAELEDQIETLKSEKAEMYDQIVSLTEVVAKKTEEQKLDSEEESLQYIPTGYPVKGYAVMVQDPTVNSDEKVKGRAVFNVMTGSAIVACADGTVIDKAEDPDFGAMVVLDHGNGYQTTYRTSGSIKVESGDELTRGQVIAVIAKVDSLFAYEIVKGNEAIEPLDMMVNY